MKAEKNSKKTPQRKTKKRILKLLLVLLVVLILLVVFAVPAFVSSESGHKLILTKINSSLDGQTDFAGFLMSWFEGIKVTDFSFIDGAGQTSVSVKQITTKPHYVSILTGSLSFGKTIIEEPKVQINLNAKRLLKSKDFQKERSADKKVSFPIKKINLVINDGNLKVTDSKTGSVELSQINSRLNLRPPGKQTDFNIDMAVVDEAKESKIHTEGSIRPGKTKTGWALKGTSGELTVELDDLDIGSLSPFFALAGIEVDAGGSISANIKSEIKDGRIENATGTILAENLDITGPALNGDRLQTGQLDINVKLARKREMINVENFDIRTDWLSAQASGTVPTTFDSFTEFLKSDSKLKAGFDLDIAEIFSQLPHTFGVKENMQVTSGRLTGDIETLTERGKRKITARANLDRLAGLVSGKQIALSQPINAAVEISSENGKINFDNLDVSAAFAKVNAEGSAEKIRYDGQLDLAKLQSELGQFIDIGRYKIAGHVLSNGEVSITTDKITAAGSSVVKNLNITSPEGLVASEPLADIAFVAQTDKKTVNINSIQAKAALGRMSVKNAVLPLNEDAKKSMKLAVSADDIDLEKLRPFVVMFASFPKEMQLAGIAQSDFSISPEKDGYRIKTDATKIKNLKLMYPGREPFDQNSVSVIFDGLVNPAEQTVNIIKFELISPQIKIYKGQLKKTIDSGKTKLEGRLDCEYDWAALGTVASPFLPPGLQIEGQRKLSVDFASQYPAGQTDKLLPNLNTKDKVALGFERAEYMGLNFGPSEVEIQIQNGLLSIAPFTTTVNNGQFNFAAEADFKQEPALLKTPQPIHIVKNIQINDEMTRKLLMYVNPIFANAVNVRGVANFNCERLAIPLAAGKRNNIEVAGTISMSQIQLDASDLLGQLFSLLGTSMRGQDIVIHPTRFILQNERLHYENMQIDIGRTPVNFKGTIGLDKSLDMMVILPFTLKGTTARVDKETVGSRISLPLKGTIDKPELDLGRLLEEQLKQELQKQLEKGLKDLFK